MHAHELIPGSMVSLYDHVIWNGHQFPGHWSWIYVARNDPIIAATTSGNGWPADVGDPWSGRNARALIRARP